MECMRDNFFGGRLLDGRFETIALLNHGSFGMVFKAKDTQTNEVVAIKCLTKASAAGAMLPGISVDDRSEELACHARLGAHANIVNMIHHFESDAHVFLVLEFCAMGDLYEAIRLGRGPRETDNVRDFMLQLLGAVEYMHSKGMYHRDIKPENIFLMPSGDMKLGDFGLATVESWTYESTVGSDRYMSPEQYDSSNNGYSPAKADIWAIGICLLNILFSRNPFVTPTESDVLFADYVRDKQSLFDIFPTMSQDTFEVLNVAMAIDPEKRSLSAVREALLRVVSFTTDDETLDDFCTEDHGVVPASANREPLRTPSISSPHTEQAGAFPWATALRTSSPQQVRQLSAIPDTEEYAEELLYGSVESKDDVFSLAPETLSIASALDSGLGASMKSLAMRKSDASHDPPRSAPMPISGSVPTLLSRPAPAMASVFGQKEVVSRSWSDLWDEEEEDTEVVHVDVNQKPRATEDKDSGKRVLVESTSSSARNRMAKRSDGTVDIGLHDGAQEDDVFFFEAQQSPRSTPPPRYTPPSRRDIMDKWAALGDRRRAYHDQQGPTTSHGIRSGNQRDSGFSRYDRVELGAWDEKDTKDMWGVEYRELEDMEWLGGWNDLHV
ncbi:MAG: hypothetical protein M1838_005085 [Thelocarpon superellum]|nr:MAG: hypothetical protein M1838_005085 [Thelocarpon superellum]